LVSLYGLPGHDELDPTFVLAATTPLFFGMMFGDVGQGLLLGALAIALRRRLGRWVAPAVSWSLGSVIFGLLYGSVFGVEHWLPALWLRPMSDPFRLLGAGLAIGVVFLLLTFLLGGVNLALRGRWREALFGFRGAAGASVYASGVLLLRALYLGQPLPGVALGLLAAGIALTVVHAAHEVRVSGRAVLGTLATEYFHGILGLFTGTLSFLRLAAFALNHAALSLALFMVVDMFPASDAWLVVRVLVLVIGSTFILALDVLVVTVQTIRLEFYEGLTRYYRGDGRAYQPLRFTHATTT
jgi:V/A-type H+-transporting ATPase subunit I